MTWCDEKQFSDDYIIENRKFLAFIQQIVITRRVKKKKRRKIITKREEIEEMSVEDEADAAIINNI